MSEESRSVLLDLPGAVAGDGIDAPVAAHYGSFTGEQRTLEAGEGFVDLSHRDVVRVTGPDRLPWLHSLTSQHLEGLPAKQPTAALVLSPQGHVEHAMYGMDDGEAFTVHVEPGMGQALVEWLDRMRFMMRVEVADVTAEVAVTWRPRPPVEPGESRPSVEPSASVEPVETTPVETSIFAECSFVPRSELKRYADAVGPACGLAAFEALRIARGEPRLGLDTDARTIPNEVGWIGPAVHLDKGCYRGQETVARVHTLGRPPRRLTLLHLDGSVNRLPAQGTEIEHNGRTAGFVGTSARHHELGPIALALVKRNVPLDTDFDVDGIPAAQEVIVDPEIGMHVRPNLR